MAEFSENTAKTVPVFQNITHLNVQMDLERGNENELVRERTK